MTASSYAIRRRAPLAGVLAFLSFFTPVNSQQRGMRAAQRHIDLIAPRIHADPRFAKIELEPYTGPDGSLSVNGSVVKDADLADLKRLIEETKPPVEVIYFAHSDEEIERFNHQSQ